ncbi:MAG: hypothetical protein IJE87_06150 [Firmicutes bacterium]|nr:hypothetical protein [Bacillota bacterium]
MKGKLRRECESEMGMEIKLVAFLYDEKEYAEALVEHLLLRFHWGIVLCDALEEEVEDADLILAESGWFEQLRERDDLWDKTVFLLEDRPQEIPLTRNEFPYLVWKYDGFERIRQRIAKALEEKCGNDVSQMEEKPPAIVVGAWDYEKDDCWELACELAGKIRKHVLYLNLEKYSGEGMKEALELDHCLEDILYYVLDRLELDGINTSDTIRSIVDIRNGVCSLPDFQGYNPLLRLQKQQWNLLLNSLYEATGAEAVLMWMGREDMDRFPFGAVEAVHCLYIKPQNLNTQEEKRWRQMKCGMDQDLKELYQMEVKMVDSWTEAMEVIQKYGYDMA